MTTVLPEPGRIDSEGFRTVAADVVGDEVRVAVDDLPDLVGWTLRPEGLCRGDVCVPVRDLATIERGDRIDLTAVADVLGAPVVVDAESDVVALGVPASRRSAALTGGEAPNG